MGKALMYSALISGLIILFDISGIIASGEKITGDLVCLFGVGFVLLTLFLWFAYIIGSILLKAELNVLRWLTK